MTIFSCLPLGPPSLLGPPPMANGKPGDPKSGEKKGALILGLGPEKGAREGLKPTRNVKKKKSRFPYLNEKLNVVK